MFGVPRERVAKQVGMNVTQITAAGVSDGSRGDFLQGKPLPEYFEGTEEPEFVLSNENRGIEHETGDGTETIEPGPNCRAVAAITDERVLLVVGNSRDDREGDREVSIPYTDLRSIETNTGVLKSRLSLTTETSERFHIRLRGRRDLTPVEKYVQRAVWHWKQFDRQLEDARASLAQVETSLENGETDDAVDAYRKTRERLLEATRIAEDYRDGDHAMHRRIEAVRRERTVTEIDGYRMRAEELFERAAEDWEDGEYRSAIAAYKDSIEQYDQAIDRAADIEYEEREELEAAREAVADELDARRSEPIREVRTVCDMALMATDPDNAVWAWQQALDTTHDALSLLLTEPTFEGDPDALRFQVEWIAQNLLRAHCDAGINAEARGNEYCMDSAEESGRQAYERACDHLEAAKRVANEFRSGDPDEIDPAIERIEDKIDTLTDDQSG